MPDDAAPIDLPRYARPIGIARTSEPESRIQVSPDPVSVLTPFAGVLATLNVAEPVIPTFTYLALQPLVVTSVRERRRDGAEPAPRGGRYRTEATDETRVYHLLERSVSAETDRPDATDRPGPSGDGSIPGQPRASRARAGNEGPELLQDITVLHLQSTVGQPPAESHVSHHLRERDRSALQRRAPPTSDASPEPDADSPVATWPTASPLRDTTVLRTVAVPPVPRPASTWSHPQQPGSGRTEPSPGFDVRQSTEGVTEVPPRPEPAAALRRERPAMTHSPELTVARAGPGPGRSGPARSGESIDGQRRPGVTPMISTSEDPSPHRTDPAGTGHRPPPHATMTAILDDRTQMNRMVDRLYQEFQRKLRIERERRGL